MSIPVFLRWAGGKQWLAKALAPVIRGRLTNGSSYFEPFLGSGAMYFGIQPRSAFLSDLNHDLMTTFQEVRSRPESIVEKLSMLSADEDTYYTIREWRPNNTLDQAVRFIYLNRNCYGGIYRENRKGQFNVPFGGGSRNHYQILREATIEKASSIMQSASITYKCCDFESALQHATSGDVVYCDPTYTSLRRESFDRYGRVVFDWFDQERLAEAAQQAFRRGALVIVSSSAEINIANLMTEAQRLNVQRPKGLGGKPRVGNQRECIYVFDPDNADMNWAKALGMKESVIWKHQMTRA